MKTITLFLMIVLLSQGVFAESRYELIMKRLSVGGLVKIDELPKEGESKPLSCVYFSTAYPNTPSEDGLFVVKAQRPSGGPLFPEEKMLVPVHKRSDGPREPSFESTFVKNEGHILSVNIGSWNSWYSTDGQYIYFANEIKRRICYGHGVDRECEDNDVNVAGYCWK